MAYVNQDDVARFAVGAADWASLTPTQQLDLEILVDDVEAAINQYIGDRLGRRTRLEVIRQVSIPEQKGVIPVDRQKQVRNRIYLRYAPIYQGTIVVKRGEDLSQLMTYGVDYVVDDMIAGVSKQGCLFRKEYWPDPIQVQYQGGFDETSTPEEWKLIRSSILFAVRSVYIDKTSNVTSTGVSASGTVKREKIGKYEYEIDTSSTSSTSSSDNAGATDGLLPASVIARLSRLNKPAMYV